MPYNAHAKKVLLVHLFNSLRAGSVKKVCEGGLRGCVDNFLSTENITFVRNNSISQLNKNQYIYIPFFI